jgi:hypothetical protein
VSDFLKIKRAKVHDFYLEVIPDTPFGAFLEKDIKEERLSRAEWARALAQKLEGRRVLAHRIYKDNAEEVMRELLKQAECDEK